MTTALVTRPTRAGGAAIRIRHAPALEPPFEHAFRGAADDFEAPGPMLPLDWPGAEVPPGDAIQPNGEGQPGDAVRPGDAAAPDGSARMERGIPPAEPVAVPGHAGLAARRFVRLCVEVLNGFRPAGHLRPFVSPPELASVTAKLLQRTARRHRLGPRPGIRIKALHVAEPRAGVAEVAAVLTCDRATWAMAIRLERGDRAWLCTVIEVV